MDEDCDYNLEDLERCSYRYLQQLAKALSLPSNVKKIYLIQLIYAKKYHTEAEVMSIIQQVRLERQQLAQTGKKGKKRVRLQGTEISSTNTTHSPPIGMTPRRNIVVNCSPDEHKYPRQSLLRPSTSQISTVRSDRVLRSFNMKPYKKSTLIGVIKSKEAIDEVSFPKMNMTTCIVKKRMDSSMERQMQLVVVSSSANNTPTKRHRCFNGLQPVRQTKRLTNQYIQSIGFRRTDGKITKINALVQKSTKEVQTTTPNYGNVEVTIQDIINYNIDAQTFTNPNAPDYVMTEANNSYPNMSCLTDVVPQSVVVEKAPPSLLTENHSLYYHKKIRAEQVRSQRSEALPKIAEAFSQFNNLSDVTRPLYVHVDGECAPSPRYSNPQPAMLESLYNLRGQYLPSMPRSTADTRCVYSTRVVPTAVQQTPAAATADQYHFASSERDSQYPGVSDDVSRMCEFLRLEEQEITLRKYHEAMNTSTSSLESQELGATVTIPEMVEDALELISQDGDYMERIGMDVRVQCILCSWAGPKIILEHHIRTEHSDQIAKNTVGEWCLTFELGALVEQPLWLSHVTELDSSLYALSVKYEDPDCFMAVLSTLSETECRTGSITVYNKVTGEPFTWEGEVPSLPDSLPHTSTGPRLLLRPSMLGLRHNSAKLRLHNRMLVPQEMPRAVIGPCSLNDVQITVYVRVSL